MCHMIWCIETCFYCQHGIVGRGDNEPTSLPRLAILTLSGWKAGFKNSVHGIRTVGSLLSLSARSCYRQLQYILYRTSYLPNRIVFHGLMSCTDWRSKYLFVFLFSHSVSLERAWGSSRIVSRDDWDQWLKTLTTALLRESPSPAIRACSQLTAIAPVIGRTLFNAAFVSCWPELTPPQQDSLVSTLEWVLRVADQSPDVSQTILNLEEFMAHVDKVGFFPFLFVVLQWSSIGVSAQVHRTSILARRFLHKIFFSIRYLWSDTDLWKPILRQLKGELGFLWLIFDAE